MTEHVTHKRALYLAALPESEPAKQRAREHAASCTSCARLLQEGGQLLSLIDRSAPPPAVDAQLAARVKQAVFGQPQPAQLAEPARWLRLRWAWLAGGVLSALMIGLDARPHASLATQSGLDCVLFENAYAVATCVAAAIWARTRRQAIDPWTGSAIGMSGALVGQWLLRTHCSAAHAALHLFAFHLLGVLIGTALGALATPALTRRR
jgi:hypothetical protein